RHCPVGQRLRLPARRLRQHPHHRHPLVQAGDQIVEKRGIIETTADGDCFSFTTSGGWVNLRVEVAEKGPNLHALLELQDANGTLVSRAFSPHSGTRETLGATLTANLGPGRYYLTVRSYGEYGDVGQYKVTGTVPNAVNYPNLVAQRIEAQVLSRTSTRTGT